MAMRANVDHDLGEEGGGGSRSGRPAMIMLEKPAQAGCKNHRTRQISLFPLLVSHFLQRFIILALMRSLLIVPSNVFRAEIAKILFTKADKIIEALLLYALDKSFGIGIEIRLHRANALHFHVLFFEDSLKVLGVLGVKVADEHGRLHFPAIPVHANITCLLLHPGIIGVGRHPSQVHSSRIYVNEKQHKDINQTLHCPDFLAEEVGGPQGISMLLDEVGPKSFATLGTWMNAFCLQDVLHRTLTDRGTQLLEFAENTTQTPAIVLGHANHELTNLLQGFGPSWLAFLLPAPSSFLLLVFHPSQESAWRDDADKFLDGFTHWFAKLEQLATFLGCDHHPLTEPVPQDPILSFEILHLFSQLPIDL